MAHHDPGHQVTSWRDPGVAGTAVVSLAGLVLGAAVSGSLASAVVFALALGVFVAPGVLLAGRWFSGQERIAIGIALGYFSSSLIASILYRAGISGPSWLAAAIVGLLVLAAIAMRRNQAMAGDPPPTNRLWLGASVALAMVLVALPFLRVGEATPAGIAYRAYFSADLMTHLSVVAELQKGSFPPQNPFYSGLALGYQWLFFLFPAVVGRWIGNQPALLLTNLSVGCLFAALVFSVAHRLAGSARVAFLTVGISIGAASYEGLALLVRAAWLGEPLASFRNVNVDAFSRWFFELTSLDGLYRSLLYTPQHLYSYCLLLILTLLFLRGATRGPSGSLMTGALLGGMAGTSIVTAMIAGPWVVIGRLVRGGDKGAVLRDLVVMGTVAVGCLAWYFELRYFGEAGGALVPRWPRLAEVPAIVFLEAGPLFLLGLPALAERHALPLAGLAGLALMAVFFVDIGSYPGVWMAWRAGSVLLVALSLIVSVTLGKRRPWVLAVVLLPATLTCALDLFNAQDVSNRELSRGEFFWTTIVPPSDHDALVWIRTHTPPQAIVQWDVRAREPGEWALVPALAERRMAVGFPIFLLDNRKYRARERTLRPIFVSGDPDEAHRLATEAGIDYLVIGSQEVAVRGELVRKLWETPDRFREVYSNRGATVFEVIDS